MLLKRLVAILTQRCPVCLRGRVFHSLLGMNAECAVCGIHFERETGYFLNAMLAAYVLGFLLLIPTAILLLLQQVNVGLFAIIIVVEMVLLWPLIFRYSRVMWLHLDQLLDPRPHVLTTDDRPLTTAQHYPNSANCHFDQN